MSITISTYTKFDELRRLLASRETGGAIFVVPTANDGEWLPAGCKSFVWSSLYRDLAQNPLRQIDPPDHRLILKHIIDNFKSQNLETVRKLPGVSRAGFTDLLSNSLHELLREEISPESLDEANDGVTREILKPLYMSYMSDIERHGLMDSTQVATKTREAIENSDLSEKKFVFVGFLSFTHGQKNLIDAMSLRGAEISILKPEAHTQGLRDASVQFADQKRGYTSNIDGGNYFILDSADTLCELEVLARELALWSSGVGALATLEFPGWGGIGVLTQRARLNEFETALARYGVPASVFSGKRVSETPLGYLPSLIYHAYRGGFEEGETGLLLAQPCLSGENAMRGMTKFCRTLEKGGTPSELLKTLHTFATAKGIWLDALQKIIADDETGIFDSSLRELSSALSELERKITFMDELQPKIGLSGDVKMSGAEAAEYLSQWAQDAQTATAPAIENSVSLFTELPSLASFEVFIITGATAKNFPGSLTASPLLGEEAKEKLNESRPNEPLSHLPTLHEQRIQKDALFKRLLHAGEKFAIISRPMNDEKGRPLSPSPSFAPILQSEDWKLLGKSSRRISVPSDGFYFPEIEILADEPKMPRFPPIMATHEPVPTVSMSKLDELIECPFLYWARQIKKLTEPQRGIYDAAKAGELAHKIWETAWRTKIETGESLQKIVAEIWGSLLNVSPLFLPCQREVPEGRRDCGAEHRTGFARIPPAPLWQGGKRLPGVGEVYPSLFTDERLARRRDLLQKQMIDSATFQDEIETRLQRTGIELETKVSFERDGVRFNGRCDRIDILNDGCVIIDYKSGKSEQKFQLGGYAIAMQEMGRNVLGAGHITLKGDAASGSFAPPFNEIYMGKKSKSTLEGLISDTESALVTAAATVKGGKYAPNYESKLCCRCAFVPLCRRAEMHGEAIADEEEDDML